MVQLRSFSAAARERGVPVSTVSRRVARLEGWDGEASGISVLYRSHRALTAAVRACVDQLLPELPGTDLARTARGQR